MNKYKLPIKKEWVIEAGLMVDEGEDAMKKLIESENIPEAITCANDMLALGVMRHCKKYGISVPNDLAVTGFTKTPFSELVDPPLTSVIQPTYEMGEIAAKLLLKQIENDNMIPETVILNGILNIRASSKKD